MFQRCRDGFRWEISHIPHAPMHFTSYPYTEKSKSVCHNEKINTTDHKRDIYVSFLPVLLYNVSSNHIHPHRGAEPEHNKNNVLLQDASSSSF